MAIIADSANNKYVRESKLRRLSTKVFVGKLLIFLTILTGCGGEKAGVPHDTISPTITLLNDANMTLHIGDTYSEAGAKAIDNNDGNITADINIAGTVDTSAAGIYKIIYTVRDKVGNKAFAIRTVEVADNQAPTIKLIGSNHIYLSIGEVYHEQGATAIDDNDGNITADINITGRVDTSIAGTYEIIYSVKDMADNNASAVRNVEVLGDQAPVIKLIGNSYIHLSIGDVYHELGATAIDDNDGNITADINITGIVDTSIAGLYKIIYTVKDTSKNYASITRKVSVDSNNLSETMIIDPSRNAPYINLHDAIPAGAYYSYESDPFVEPDEKVLSLHSSGIQNSFHILGYETDAKYSWWTLPSHQNRHIISWDSNFHEDFIIYIVLKFTTAEGEMIRLDLVYTPSEDGYDGYTNNFMHIYLGADAKDGKWHHYSRDVDADLQRFYPGGVIDFDNNVSGYVNGIAIRGTGKITNLKLSAE